MNLNFSISELCNSPTANKFNINNAPNLKSLDNLLNLIFYVLQPLRDELSKPIIITSGFRCPKLNNIVKGKPNSQHLEGKAADFIVRGMKVKEVISFILNSNIEYDQLIDEYGKWIHISFNKGLNRKQFLKF